MAETIQIKYDELSQLANRINQQADEMQAMYQKVASKTEDLATSWLGVGANAFQQEMEELVLPGLKRLYEGLGQTSQTLGTLAAHWQATEEEATALFPTE
jgi:WXG100 family type VII secretion target